MSEIESTEGETPELETGELAQDDTLAEPSTVGEEAPAEPEKPKAKGVQKRLDELTKLRYDAERDRDYWRELAVSKTKQPEAPEPEPVAPTGKPQLDQYDSYEAYTEALTDWKVDQRFKSQQEEVRKAQEATQVQQRVTTFQQRAQAFETEAEDFRAVAFNPSLPVSDAMAEAIQSSEQGPQLLYHLGKNPQEAARIASLNPYQAAMELGRLEAKLSAPQPRRTTGAPPPIEPLTGASGGLNDPMKLSPEEWARKRNQELAARKR